MDYWTLPGADAFLDSVRAKVLEDEENVIVALPETAPPGLADALKTKLHSAGAWDVHHYMADGCALEGILYAAMGVNAPASVADLIKLMCDDRPVIIEAITPEIAQQSLLFLQEYANASRNVNRPNLLVIITTGLAASTLPNAPKLTAMAWNGWIGEADVLVFIVHHWRQQKRTFDRASRLCTRIICNLALWDITLARRLMVLADRNWYHLCDLEQIQTCLAGTDSDFSMQCNWESGGEALFDGQIHRHLNTLTDTDELRSELTRRLWAAQAAHLLPILEKRRLDLVQKIKATGKLGTLLALNGNPVSDLDAVELGGLMHLAQTHHLPQKIFKYADKLRHLRNQLAHLKPLNAGDVDYLLRE